MSRGTMLAIRRSIRTAALTLWLPASGLTAQQLRSDIPATPFIRPAGPYAVGTYDTLWIDQRRSEPYTKDPSDKRRLPMRIWYPAEPVAGGAPANYIVAPAEFGPSQTFKPVEHVKT